MTLTRRALLASIFVAISVTSTRAAGGGDADVDFVAASQSSSGSWTFSVEVSHADTGWDDYCDGWDVVDDSTGTVLKLSDEDEFTRLLLHPHVDEQPFTRSQSGLVIDGPLVTVRAHDLKDGWGGREVNVDLCRAQGERYSVSRFEGSGGGGTPAFSPPCTTDDDGENADDPDPEEVESTTTHTTAEPEQQQGESSATTVNADEGSATSNTAPDEELKTSTDDSSSTAANVVLTERWQWRILRLACCTTTAYILLWGQ